MRRTGVRYGALAALVTIGLLLAACGGSGAQSSDGDLLVAIQERGTLRLATDPNYPPQSFLDDETGQWKGFDIDVAREVARRLGVDLEFETPAWDLIVTGNWQDRWDISIGSMTITPERMAGLYFTQPYYTTPAQLFVHEENAAFAAVTDVSGKRIGVCGGCTYEEYLNKSLTIPGVEIAYRIDEAEVRTYETDLYALEDLSLGDGVRLDAVLTALPTGTEAIDKGLGVKKLGEPVYFEYLAAAVDRHASRDPLPLVERISEVIREMHADGTLRELSMKWYGIDLASAAAEYEVPEQD